MKDAVSILVSAALVGTREAVGLAPCAVGWMNPAEARRIASDLIKAAEVVDQLCPSPALTLGTLRHEHDFDRVLFGGGLSCTICDAVAPPEHEGTE